ncbi:MAG: hypothetical protein N2322_06400, partial [Terrimicrobiaceae bacterium]|nr:hypothetical protein [Terrimicrobiaceae bacterium]
GPEEATALGNVLAQAYALGHIGSLGELRAIVRASCQPQRFEPSNSGAWEQALDRFDHLPGE